MQEIIMIASSRGTGGPPAGRAQGRFWHRPRPSEAVRHPVAEAAVAAVTAAAAQGSATRVSVSSPCNLNGAAVGAIP